MKPFLYLILTISLCSNAAEAQIASRLKAWSYTSYDSIVYRAEIRNTTLIDSAWYNYSGNCSGELSFYDAYGNTPFYAPNTYIDFGTGSFDYHGMRGLLKYDEAIFTSRQYDIHYRPYYAVSKTKLEYDSRNTLTKSKFEIYDSVNNKWTADGNDISYYYDADGKILKIDNANGNRTTYEYDSKGNVVLASLYTYIQPQNRWNSFTRDSFAYNEDNKLIAAAYQMYDTAGIWYNNDLTTYGYNSMGRMEWREYIRGNIYGKLVRDFVPSGDTTTVTMTQWDAAKKVWYTNYATKEVRNRKGQLIAIIGYGRLMGYNELVPQVWETWDYNTFNQVAAYTRYHSINSGFSKSTYRFYYETYLTDSDANSPKIVVSVYPSPASSSLSLSYTFSGIKKLETAIISVDGRICMQWTDHIANTSGVQKNIDISGLSPGVYFLKVRDDKKDVIMRRFLIAR